VILSPQEQRVFDQIVKHALENEEIAERLGSTHRAVKFHVSNIMRKFGVPNRERLILLYWKERCRAIQRGRRGF
jgi:DNA-binding CsgD family transcriptional regulator